MSARFVVRCDGLKFQLGGIDDNLSYRLMDLDRDVFLPLKGCGG